ncbi:MAG: hypothetical protein M3069_12260 [Chloroflexota bacterium]|nr:hypothetical protein [Chloroflexota bacterium]
MMACNTAETLARLQLEQTEREWKMAALAAQLPRSSRPGYRELLARGLRALASSLDPELAPSTERPLSTPS